MRLKFFVILAFCCGFVNAQNTGIVPKPKSIEILPEKFQFSYKTKIVANSNTGRKAASFLNDYLLKFYGFKLEVIPKMPRDNSISFDWNAGADTPENEAYGLSISKKRISITSLNERGFFYGLQSFIQLLPADMKNGNAEIQGMRVEDEPRFRYRGMHLDVARHFMPLSFVKKYIDLMAQYKFNYFHWHLTEDQGWRIEIKRYPKLTGIGSKRKETVKEKNLQPYIGDGIPVEGFYTQEQVKEVVAYAKDRKITVIPEIEFPGHSSALLAAYPELGCKENYEYKVQTTWGIFKETVCPTEKTFQFYEGVLEETITLFPDSPYIHIGGDEVLKDHWKESAFVQDLMKRENLKDEHEVQSYMIRRIEKFINSKGKKMIGWDEILEGGLAPNAVVMSWRGIKGGIEAAKAKHDVIMTPTDYCYLDYGQGDPKYEPIFIGGYLPLEKVYSFDPVPKELSGEESKYVLGVQGNVWSEYMKTPDKVEYMAFPRMLAIAEIAWSPLDNRNFEEFKGRLPNQFSRLDKQGVNYRIPAPDGLKNIIQTGDKANIQLKAFDGSAKIFYTLDGSEPSERSSLYTAPLEIPLNENQRMELKVAVVNQKGRKSVTYSAMILRRNMLSPVEVADKKPGVVSSFFKGSFSKVKEMDTSANPPEITESKSILLQQFAAKSDNFKQPFGVIFDGYLYAPEDDLYEFELESDNGAVLIIGEEAAIDLDGIHGRKMESGMLPLKKGFHKLRLKYFHIDGDALLNLRWGIKGRPLQRINGGNLIH